MQTPATIRTNAHKKSRIFKNVRENTTFAEVVNILESAQIAEEGLEPPTRGL